MLNKKYTMEDFKEIFDSAVVETLAEPVDDDEMPDDVSDFKKIQFNLQMMLTGTILFSKLRRKIFEEEE